jgi:hypothetical protein
MLKLQTKALAAMAVAGLVCAAGEANAQSQSLSNEPVSIVVQNNFTLSRTNALNFGTYVVFAHAGNNNANTATLTMAPGTGVVTPVNNPPARFVAIDVTSQSRGVYAISGAAPSTIMNVATANPTDLGCSAGACTTTLPAPPVITLTSVTPASGTVTTSGTGTATINIGAVLTTVAGGEQYADGTYTGDFDLTVNY